MERESWPLSVFGDEIAPALEEQLTAIRERGLEHLELRSAWGVNVADFGGDEIERAETLLRREGVRISAIGSPLGKVPVDEDPAEEEPRLRRSLAVAERLEARLVRVFSYFVSGEYERSRDAVLRRMSHVVREAERRHLTLVLENESYLYGDVPSRCVDVLESVGSPALRFAFDPANFVQCGVAPMRDAWPVLAPSVAHVHIKDAVPVDRSGLPPYPARAPEERLMEAVRPAGEGDGAIPELLGELRSRGYDGFLTLEPHLAGRFPDLDGDARFGVAVDALRRLLEG